MHKIMGSALLAVFLAGCSEDPQPLDFFAKDKKDFFPTVQRCNQLSQEQQQMDQACIAAAFTQLHLIRVGQTEKAIEQVKKELQLPLTARFDLVTFSPITQYVCGFVDGKRFMVDTSGPLVADGTGANYPDLFIRDLCEHVLPSPQNQQQ